MKHLVLSAAIAALTWFGAASEATARPHREDRERPTHICRYTRCGCPVYVERYIAFFDEYGDPVWRTREIPVAHRCEVERPRYCESEYREVYRVERRPPPIVTGGITIEASW